MNQQEATPDAWAWADPVVCAAKINCVSSDIARHCEIPAANEVVFLSKKISARLLRVSAIAGNPSTSTYISQFDETAKDLDGFGAWRFQEPKNAPEEQDLYSPRDKN